MPWTPACRNFCLDVTDGAAGLAPAEVGILHSDLWCLARTLCQLPPSTHFTPRLPYRLSHLKVQYVPI